MTINIWTKYKTILFGLFGSLGFALLCVLLYLIDKGELILLLLYIPGSIFGLAMAVSLGRYSDRFGGGLFILATIEYLAMVLFCSKDYEYLAIRRFLMGGSGAVLFLTTIRLFTSIKLNLNDLLLGLIFGIVSTIFMWTDNFESFNPWFTILSIALWQTTVAGIVNRRQLIIESNYMKRQ